MMSSNLIFQQTRIQIRFDIEISQEDEVLHLLKRVTALVDLLTAILLIIVWPFWTVVRIARWSFRMTGQLIHRLSWWVSDRWSLIKFILKVMSIHLVSYGYGLGLCR